MNLSRSALAAAAGAVLLAAVTVGCTAAGAPAAVPPAAGDSGATPGTGETPGGTGTSGTGTGGTGTGGTLGSGATPGTTPEAAGQVPALAAERVSYVQRNWGDPKTEMGIVIQAPKDWSMAKLSTFEVRFSSANKLWNLRVNGWATDDPVKTLADRKYRSVQSVPGFQLISRVNGSTKATNPAFSGVVFHHTTLTYSYLEPARGQRLVVERFVAFNDQPHTLFQLSAGGRPQDAAALKAITDKATADFIRLP
ncbi:hypothetical protein GCM10009789_19200 [Kribbella sancticallisti]|uniref:Lipoprotein LpqN n=1 Tax=Kribbella sancticallisti TaxID=460087 RepID=A0ABN2CX42_9ACTN